MKVWVFQRNKGKGKPWSIGWRDERSKRREKQIGSKAMAEKHRQAKENELRAGGGLAEVSWADFRREFEEKKLAGKAVATAETYATALDHFESIVEPQMVNGINARTIDDYIAVRRTHRGKTEGSLISGSTINKELRTLKRALNVAYRWNYIRKVPTIEFEQVDKNLPTFVTPEEFSSIYTACEFAKFPEEMPFSATKWWRAFLIFQYMTGWRVSEPLSLLRQDLDLKSGCAITRSGDNKASKEAQVPLHPVVVEHLNLIEGDSFEVFPWTNGRRTLWDHFHMIQTRAKVNKVCRKNHPHSKACSFYGFHDLRRGFATTNADALSASQLQTMMRHSSYATTQAYINMAAQNNTVTERLTVPDLDIKRR